MSIEENGISGKYGWYIIIIIFLLAITSFFLGRLSAKTPPKAEFEVYYPAENAIFEDVSTTPPVHTENQAGNSRGEIVASKNGTRYYLPSCSGGNRIKEENKIYFSNEKEAEIAGYTKSKTCK
ncbi:MAG: hypothetical protein OXU73_01380 [Candidatus Campbellbacteria bacterium]|nr:hypothetical protein [Candidatus Campbellbacteria bacterium]